MEMKYEMISLYEYECFFFFFFFFFTSNLDMYKNGVNKESSSQPTKKVAKPKKHITRAYAPAPVLHVAL